MFHQKHTQMPGKGNTEKNVNGQPFFPYFMAKGGAWFFFIFGALVLLSTFATINPVWLYGPYSPVAISSASQPDFYMGILEGSLRVMPAWEINFLGHTLSLSVLIPFALPLTIVLGGAALWPFFEQWATGDRSPHNINDRPRNAPVRTATGVAAMTFYGVLWAEGANDVIADKLQVPLYTITWIARVLVFVGPALGYYITKRICLGLQRKDAQELLHGYESGIIRQLPNGEFIEVHQAVNEERRAVLEAKPMAALLPGRGSEDANGVPSPGSRGALGWARGVANRAFAETVPLETNGHGDVEHGNGHAVESGEEHVAVGAAPSGSGGGHGQLPAGDAAEEEPREGG
jgi:ubiquinol-cytochrome c reductase cytochrome b subunit